MRRFLVVALPELALDRVQRRWRREQGSEDRAAGSVDVHLVVEAVAARHVVVQACQRGREAGITLGMSVAEARALVPSATVYQHHHRPDLDRRLLLAMARWMVRLTPRVATDEPTSLILDLTGCERLYADDATVMNRVHAELERFGFDGRVGMAGTVGAAWAFAWYGSGERRRCIPGGGEAAALDPLPVVALRLGTAAVDELAQVGIETIGQLRRVPRAELAGRGGGWREGGLLARLDQAMGRRPEIIEPIVPAVRPRAERLFAGPVMQPEAIVLSARELLEELVATLEQLECGLTRLQVRCACPDVAPQVFELRLGRPTRSRRHLWALLAPRLERIHLDFGVESMHLEAMRIARLDQRQSSCESLMVAGRAAPGTATTAAFPAVADAATRRRHEAALGELLDGLVDRLGPDRVLCVRGADSHVPEHAGEAVPLGEPDAPVVRLATRDECRIGEDVGAADAADAADDREADDPLLPKWAPAPAPARGTNHGGGPMRTGLDPQDPHLGSPARRRPPTLLGPPEPMELDGWRPDGTPRRFRWRDGEHLVVQAIGPERIAAPWWEARRLAGGGRGADPAVGQLVRDYFRVQDEHGRWMWIFRRMDLGRRGDRPPPTRWFVHGLWD